ncbi:nucleoside deaminase [Nitratifractor salsuginis]|uniref:CMP/dCMP deaminase zinc-binding protein n=1 Tax=Nitratifractor salsuginis (strain DSM 16511 / JCM 12458 / E9I37-1) TaxID=749222 RepID=E6X307_NITSE|nr:nucleoside deaminase [Nitratifractor salsuginis]ADV46151.1 CMP/dCMP deaminase zinc-binding protein [Nitratifractor salsuginis DSM 16511]
MNTEEYLQIAIGEARKGVEAGHGGPFGAVIVYRGEIVSTAHNEVVLRNDPTAHAEILAIRLAGEKLQRFHLNGCTLYCTGEPCPMCFSAIHWAHLDRVIYCNTKEEAAKIGFDDTFITEIIRGEKPDPIPFARHPLPTCTRLLKLWEEKEDKIPY